MFSEYYLAIGRCKHNDEYRGSFLLGTWRRPTRLPGVVLVRFDTYRGPQFFSPHEISRGSDMVNVISIVPVQVCFRHWSDMVNIIHIVPVQANFRHFAAYTYNASKPFPQNTSGRHIFMIWVTHLPYV